MQISLNIITPPDTCHYLAHQESITECDLIIEMSSEEYEQRLLAGWRHFGRQVFRPKCENCNECKSLRIPVKDYKPNRSQARNFKANHGRISLEIQEPALTDEIMDLYDRFHAERSYSRDWPAKEDEDAFSFDCSFLDNPFPVEQWMYRENGRLCGVGYVDGLKCGLSAIYFFHDPNFYSHGIGIWNVMSLINEASEGVCPMSTWVIMSKVANRSNIKQDSSPTKYFPLQENGCPTVKRIRLKSSCRNNDRGQ